MNKSTVITFIVLLLVVFFAYNQGTFIKLFHPPAPVIVSSNANNSSTRLFEYSANVEAVIRNDGGDGDIVFEATVYQKNNSWTKTLKKFFTAKETSKMSIQFDEVKLLNGDIQAQISAYSYGK